MKYKLTDETKIVFGRTLHRLVCVFKRTSRGVKNGKYN